MDGLTDTCHSYREWISDVASEYRQRRMPPFVKDNGETLRFFRYPGRDIDNNLKQHEREDSSVSRSAGI